MPEARVDPEKLERFAQHLKQFNEQLRRNVSQLNGQFKDLGSTWRDQENKKFAAEYQQTMKVVERFLQISDEHIPFLRRKAQRARDYLNER